MALRMTSIMALLLLIGMTFLSASWAQNEELIYDKIYPGPRHSFRLETAEHPNADAPNTEMLIKGKTSVTFLQPDKSFAQKLVTYYVADKNGFRARYNFSQVEYPPERDRLGLGALKAAAG